MTPKEYNAGPLTEALALLPPKMDTQAARLLCVTIPLQESNLAARRQHGNGPARGLSQFERGGGVRGVLRFPTTADLAIKVCEARNVEPTERAVWAALETDDVLNAAFTRLLLWTDPKALPLIGQEPEAWALYLRTWRPGAHERGTLAQRQELRSKWARMYQLARKELGL